MTKVSKQWSLFLAVNLGLAGYFGFALLSEADSAKAVLLPGVTTHGHYQIELDCSACHTRGMGVKQDACLNCHAAELKISKDTHPASKFSDPTNADRLKILDAQKCITCHREHVEDQTLAMGLTMPADYCYHCHQETLENRPSHKGMAFDSCANAGCHNYHDNRALYEKFLSIHADEPDHLENPVNLILSTSQEKPDAKLAATQADAPQQYNDADILQDWHETAHAKAGVNCTACHLQPAADQSDPEWQNKVKVETCAKCHQSEMDGFVAGRHGMRLAAGLSNMQPAMARLPMHAGAGHEKLDCSACHSGHRFDTKFAAVDACLKCHSDSHSLAFKQTSHFALFEAEQAGTAVAGSGVTCATCHLPRYEDEDGEVRVQHNQNDNLRPNEKMIRGVCSNCHGLQFSLNALADSNLIQQCFGGSSEAYVESIDMATAWFAAREKKKLERLEKRNREKATR